MAATRDAFDYDHPWPDQSGVTSLYKFTALDEDHPERLEQFLATGYLYHASPASFNDPWECGPSVRVPDGGKSLARVRDRLVRILRRSMPRKDAERQVTETLSNRGDMESNLLTALEETYRIVRICSLAGRKDNHLLWAHYAAAHTGICAEFDATSVPFD